MSHSSHLFPGLKFRNITADSRQVGPGDLFVAVQGATHDGHDHLDQVIGAGAAAVVVQRHSKTPNPSNGIPWVALEDTAASLGELADEFFDHPSRNLKVIGVTGTSGKTTTTFLIESILQSAGLRPGLLGTIENRYNGKRLNATHTTPNAVELQRMLREMLDLGCQSVVMEVSSHALKQHRVAGVAFDVVAFTNLTPEHLDYHPTMEDYFESKRILFNQCVQFSNHAGKAPVRIAIDHAGAPWADRLFTGPSSAKQTWKISLNQWTPSPSADSKSISGTVHYADGSHGAIQSPLIGRFNVENIMVAAHCARALGIEVEKIATGVGDLAGVPGRLERVGDLPTVLVDYAHKPDALEKVLLMLKPLGPVITVFGCGGDRDRTKRPKMGAIAKAHSVAVWVTSDNPRTEDPVAIIDEILAGIVEQSDSVAIHVEPDRKIAIGQAIASAKPHHIVLIAGKGHEDYQIVGTTKIRFDDREVAREALAQRLRTR